MTDLLLLPGDGIGPEVTAQVRRVAEALTPDLKLDERPFGGASYDQLGTPLADETLAAASFQRLPNNAAKHEHGRRAVAVPCEKPFAPSREIKIRPTPCFFRIGGRHVVDEKLIAGLGSTLEIVDDVPPRGDS